MLRLPFLLILILSSNGTLAGVYTYRDENGTLQAVSSQDEIPEKYRNKSKALSGPKVEVPANEAEVPLVKLGNSLLVQVNFGAAGNHLMVLDTGASGSMISEKLAERIGGPKGPMVKIRTASGVLLRPLMEVPETGVAGFKVRNLKMVVNDLPEKDSVQGLLGVDFLNHFKIRLDTETGSLHLEKKKK